MKLKEIPILQYQNVSPAPRRLWLPASAFKKQMDYLAGNSFRLLAMDEALDPDKDVPSGARPISLTFDNGFQDLEEHVFPVLSDCGFPATVLISPSRVGTSSRKGVTSVSYLSWNTLRALHKINVTIGAYEDTALNLNSIPQELIEEHIVNHKRALEDQLGIPIVYFGVKEGVPNKAIRELLASQGYKAFLTQCPTYRRPNPYWVGRIQIDDDDFNIFLTKISKTYLFFKDGRSWKYIRKYKLDRVGHRLSETYDRLRDRD